MGGSKEPDPFPLTEERQMIQKSAFLSLALTFVVTSTSTMQAENWPGWRGARGDGTSIEKNIPTKWDASTGENIHWKAEIAGVGHASPIIYEDRVFLVSCLLDRKQRVLISLDRKTGNRLWQKTVVNSPLETRHSLNSHASSTPTTDGELVYVSFLEIDGRTVPAPNVGNNRPVTPGEMVVAAYDFAGNQKWIAKPGTFISAHGFCSSPVVHDDLLIVNGDHDGKSYLVALNKKTGKTIWKKERDHGIRSYVTPIIRTIGGRTQMVMSGSSHIVSYDPKDGSRHWQIDGPTEQFVASMVYDGERFFMAAGFPTYHVMAIRPTGKGNVTDTHIAWHSKDAKCYVPSPVLNGGFLFVADDRGTVNAFDAKTGNRVWRERLGGNIDASLVTAGNHVYFQTRDGIMKVVRRMPEPELIAENPVGEDCFASPAISQGQLFVRGAKHLFCIGKPRAVAAAD